MAGSDYLTERELKTLMDYAGNVAEMALAIPTEAVNKLTNTLSMAETLGPILDPTMYMQQKDNLKLNQEFARAFARFHSDLMKIKKGIVENEQSKPARRE